MKTVRKAKNSWSETVTTAAEDSEGRVGRERNIACAEVPRACGAGQRDLTELAAPLFGSWRVLDSSNFPEFHHVCFGEERETASMQKVTLLAVAHLGRVWSQRREPAKAAAGLRSRCLPHGSILPRWP